jgi:hypothetical protein
VAFPYYTMIPTTHLPFHLSGSEAFCGRVTLRRPLKTAAQELAELGERGGTGKAGFAAPLLARAALGALPQ